MMKAINDKLMILGSICVLVLSGCGNGTVSAKDDTTDSEANAPIMHIELPSFDGDDYGSDEDTEDVVDDMNTSDTDNTEDNTDEDVHQMYGYQYSYYYNYVLSKSSETESNAIFSPEMLHSAFALYDYFLGMDDRFKIYNSLTGGRDYLGFANADGFDIHNTIWINDDKGIKLSDSMFYDSYIRHFDSSSVAKMCADYLKDINIDSKELFLSDDDDLKSFSCASFSNDWFGGLKKKGFSSSFTNGDGSEKQNVKMMSSISIDGNDYSEYYMGTNASACKMKYANGFEFVAILPNRDVDLSDVNILDFVNDYATVVKINKPVYFQMPLFSVNTVYTVNVNDLGLGNVQLSKDICENSNAIGTVQIDSFAVGGMSSDESVDKDSIASGNYYDMICDRPFIFYVQDTVNSDILYMGVITKIEG